MEGRQERQQDDEQHYDLFDILLVLAKRKKLIAGITAGLVIVVGVISVLMPPVYLAETKMLPPQMASSMTAQLLSQIGASSGLPGVALGAKSPNELYVSLLKSRTVLDRVIDRFGLMKLYGKDSREETRRALKDRLKVRNEIKSGIISLGVEDTDPLRCADMANAFVKELREMNKGLSVTEASQRRLFFEEQLKEAKDSLSRAEEAMKGFQEKSGAVRIDSQADAVIEGISSLRAQIAAKEVQIRVMRTYSTLQNPDIRRAEEELRGMEAQLEKLESKNEDGNVMVPTGNIPSASTEYVRRMRDLKFSETLFELLFSQYQAAKIDESRDAALIQVIEKAVPPEKRTRPKRSLMVVLALLSGLFVSSCAAFIMEYLDKIAGDPDKKERLETFKRYMSLKNTGQKS